MKSIVFSVKSHLPAFRHPCLHSLDVGGTAHHARDVVAVGAAKQLVDGDAELLAEAVVQGNVDGRDL